jgi:hypothetical protein
MTHPIPHPFVDEIQGVALGPDLLERQPTTSSREGSHPGRIINLQANVTFRTTPPGLLQPRTWRDVRKAFGTRLNRDHATVSFKKVPDHVRDIGSRRRPIQLRHSHPPQALTHSGGSRRDEALTEQDRAASEDKSTSGDNGATHDGATGTRPPRVVKRFVPIILFIKTIDLIPGSWFVAALCEVRPLPVLRLRCASPLAPV